MSTLSPIKMPPPPEEPQPQEGSKDKNHQEEEKLRKEFLMLISSGSFKFSRRVMEKATLEYLKEIKVIYDQQRARHLVKMLISYLAVFVARGLHKIDCMGEQQVEPLITSLTEDELLEQDLVWLLGKMINSVPCPGLVSAGGKVGVEVVKHKWGKKLKKAEKAVIALAKETKDEVGKKKAAPPPKRANSLSSVSSVSSDEGES